jgi:tripartite-type tricarboxylate transporter receptor subunit TctC
MIRTLLTSLAALALLFGGTASAQASFPTREVTLVVPVAAGGGSDMTMRALARELEPILGVPVVVVNRTGAGGAVGLSEVMRARPDGYTLVMITEYNYNLPMTQDVPFTVDDFIPIATVNFDPAAIGVGSASALTTIEEFVDFARANPGVLTIGNSGFGNIWHIAAAAFEDAAGLDLVHVPFGGAAPTITATLGGHISAMVASPPEMAAQVEAGTMRLLATMGIERSTLFPDVPTLGEAGFDLQFGTWRGIGAPVGTPDDVIAHLEEAIEQAVQSQGFVDFMVSRGLGILYRSSAETKAYMEADAPRFRALMAEIGILRE